jgi:hypothetical protein
MGLRETLADIKKESARQIPEDAKEVMRRAIRQLADSGQVEGALGAGDEVPAFEVKDLDGERVTAGELLSRAPLVLQFYRGHW